ncbi:LHFPL tetraspan subfamily member 6 protein-like isoform X2 [Photinus pyralis]|uniref:LHFPL tetraspan subfamily member 6 protein-like isoform X2 n=1 Tax=Photinus pyralis TaxID=7054 RepID=UPI001266EE43|nr:LHFPL tetraspan subfamily member 6 protein-like isoform X2 [Photinus pyralis]
MGTSLTAAGFVWATLSLMAAILCCTGFYLPYWIQGRLLGKVDAYFNSFRRCNYPRVSPEGIVEIVEECGRYTRFWDIPSPWWQASTVLVGTGSALSLLIAVTATAACCIKYVVYSTTARIAGILQFTSGSCQHSWSVYVLASAVLILLLCVCLSFCASRVNGHSFRM